MTFGCTPPPTRSESGSLDLLLERCQPPPAPVSWFVSPGLQTSTSPSESGSLDLLWARCQPTPVSVCVCGWVGGWIFGQPLRLDVPGLVVGALPASTSPCPGLGLRDHRNVQRFRSGLVFKAFVSPGVAANIHEPPLALRRTVDSSFETCSSSSLLSLQVLGRVRERERGREGECE